jgi:hypothetical protein
MFFTPGLPVGYSRVADPMIAAVSMSNPTSIAWAIEMWGYGYQGLGTWLLQDSSQVRVWRK